MEVIGLLTCVAIFLICYVIIAIILIAIFILNIIEHNNNMRDFKKIQEAYYYAPGFPGEWKLVGSCHLKPVERIDKIPIGDSIGEYLVVDKKYNPYNKSKGFLVATYKRKMSS